MTNIAILVETTFRTPTGGWSVELVKAMPQGINERILILEIQASPPARGAIVTQDIQDHNVSYREIMVSDRFYEGVEVRRPDMKTGSDGSAK